MPYGFIGVDIFFAISGFIMMHVVGQRPPMATNLRDFLGHRFLRIYGWYLPCVVLAWRSWPAKSSLVSDHEIGSARRPSSTLDSVADRNRSTLAKPSGSFVTTPFVLEFLAGALFYLHKDTLARRSPFYACAALVLLWLGIRYQATNEFIRIRTFGAAAVFLLGFFVTLEQANVFRAGMLAVLLGDAFYSIYLLHLPFMTLFHGTGLRELLVGAGPLLAEAGFWVFLLAFLMLCAGLHYWIERPLYLGLCRMFGLRRSQPRPVAATLRSSV